MHFSITSRTPCVMINSIEINQFRRRFRAGHFSLPKTGLGGESYDYSSRQAQDRGSAANGATGLVSLTGLCLNNHLLTIAPRDSFEFSF